MSRSSIAGVVLGSLLIAAAVGGAVLLGNRSPWPPSTWTTVAREEPRGVEGAQPPAAPETPAAGAALAPGVLVGEGGRREVEAPAGAAAAPRTGVAGVVLEAESGAPVRRFSVRGRGAGEVALPSRTLDTADGSFEVLDVPPGWLRLEFDAEGFVPEVVTDLEVAQGSVLRVGEVRLQLGVTVRGTVVELGSLTPVEGALVQVVEEGGPTSRTIRLVSASSERVPATTGPDGRFQVVGRPPGTLRLGATHPSFASALAEPIEAKGGNVVEGVVISLSRGGGLDGYAIRDGRPLPPTARVLVLPAGDLLEAWVEPRYVGIDETGYFRVEHVSPGRYSVLASVPVPQGEPADPESSARKPLHAVVLVEEGRTTRVEFPDRTKEGCTLRGRVSRGGAGVGNASVFLVPTPWPEEAEDPYRGWPAARTLADGAFRFEHVPPGPAILQVQTSPSRNAGTSARRGFTIEVPPRPEHEVDVLLTGGTILGRVVRASDGAAIAGVHVGIVSASLPSSDAGDRMTGCTTDQEGRYGLGDLEPGLYVVSARIAELGESEEEGSLATESRGPVEVVDGGETVVDFALARGGTAVVHVSDPSGGPVKNVGVLVVPAAGLTGLPRMLAGGMGETDEKGIARIAGLLPGRYYATVPETELAGAESDAADVQRDVEASFRVELRSGTRVRVRVLDETETAVDLVTLWTDARGRERFAVPAHAWGGTFRREDKDLGIAVLLPGEYTVRVGGGRWKERTTTVHVGTRSPQEVVLRLERREVPK